MISIEQAARDYADALALLQQLRDQRKLIANPRAPVEIELHITIADEEHEAVADVIRRMVEAQLTTMLDQAIEDAHLEVGRKRQQLNSIEEAARKGLARAGT